jgi:hypothetical protein
VAVGQRIYIEREISAAGSATTRSKASSPGLLSYLICVLW